MNQANRQQDMCGQSREDARLHQKGYPFFPCGQWKARLENESNLWSLQRWRSSSSVVHSTHHRPQEKNMDYWDALQV